MTRIISFDADTGAVVDLPQGGLTGAVGAEIASHVLPGMTPEAIDSLYTAWLVDADPVPFRKGAHVQLGASGIGIGAAGEVKQRVETDGELHSILVLWPSGGTAWYHPRELVEVKP